MLLAVGGICIGASYRTRMAAEQQVAVQAEYASQEARHMQQEIVIFSEKIVPPRHPFNAILQELGINSRKCSAADGFGAVGVRSAALARGK